MVEPRNGADSRRADHIDPGDVYRLGEADLTFGELLPDRPGWLEQEEYEERTSVGFNLERLAKRVAELRPAAFVVAARQDGGEE